jgi:phosphatidylserine decarboxylase
MPGVDSLATLSPHTPTPTVVAQQRSASVSPEPTVEKKRRFRRKRQGPDYNFSAENDIVGIVMLEIRGASDLPKLKNCAFLWLPSSFLLF